MDEQADQGSKGFSGAELLGIDLSRAGFRLIATPRCAATLRSHGLEVTSASQRDAFQLHVPTPTRTAAQKRSTRNGRADSAHGEAWSALLQILDRPEYVSTQIILGVHSDPFSVSERCFDLALKFTEALLSRTSLKIRLQSSSALLVLLAPIVRGFADRISVTLAFSQYEARRTRGVDHSSSPEELLSVARTYRTLGIPCRAQVVFSEGRLINTAAMEQFTYALANGFAEIHCVTHAPYQHFRQPDGAEIGIYSLNQHRVAQDFIRRMQRFIGSRLQILSAPPASNELPIAA